MEAKSQWRARVRGARAAWRAGADPGAVAARARALAELVLADPSVSAACASGRVVTCFASLPAEPPTDEMLVRLAATGARVLLPVVRPGRLLHWCDFTGLADLRPAGMGIREPVGAMVAADPDALASLDPAVLLIPALAVDESGTRLGQGGGYYDTLLASLAGSRPRAAAPGPRRPDVVAIVGPGEVLPAGTLPREPHDVPIDRWVVG